MRGRPASSAGALSSKPSRSWTASTPCTRVGRAVLVGAGHRVDLDDARALGRVGVERRAVDGAVGDVVGLELEHRLVLALRVDGGAQRHAVDRVPGQLGGAEQAAVVLRRDPDRVGRPAGGRGRLRAGQAPGGGQAVEAAAHVGEGGRLVLVLLRRARRRAARRRSRTSCRRSSRGPRRPRSGRRRPRTAARAACGRRRRATAGPRRRRRAGRRRRRGASRRGAARW